MQNLLLALLVTAGYLCVQSWRSLFNTTQNHNKYSQYHLSWISLLTAIAGAWCAVLALIAWMAHNFNLDNTNFGQNMSWVSFICFVVSFISNQININYVQHKSLTSTHA